MKALTRPLFWVFLGVGFFSSPLPLGCLYARVVKMGIRSLAVQPKSQHRVGGNSTRASAICMLFAWNILVSKYKLNSLWIFWGFCFGFFFSLRLSVFWQLPTVIARERMVFLLHGFDFIWLFILLFFTVSSISFSSSLALLPSPVKHAWCSNQRCPVPRAAGSSSAPATASAAFCPPKLLQYQLNYLHQKYYFL